MRRLSLMFLVLALSAPLGGCVVYERPVRPHAAAVWVPGHWNGWGSYERGHWS